PLRLTSTSLCSCSANMTRRVRRASRRASHRHSWWGIRRKRSRRRMTEDSRTETSERTHLSTTSRSFFPSPPPQFTSRFFPLGLALFTLCLSSAPSPSSPRLFPSAAAIPSAAPVFYPRDRSILLFPSPLSSPPSSSLLASCIHSLGTS